MELTWWTILKMIWVASASVLQGGSPFAAKTVIFPTNGEGKYVISSDGIRMAFTTHGGALTNLWVNDTHGMERDIVLGLDDVADFSSYEANPFLNGVIGRYAGMISGAGFEIDGVQYQTSPNGAGGKATFNGGTYGWGRRTLDIASHSHNSITFVIFDTRERNGFPGTPGACITHTVTPNQWHIAIGFTPVREPTPVSISQQVFWNLDGFDKDSNRTIYAHDLHLPFSGMRFAVDEDKIPTGDITGNRPGTPFDFWSSERKLDTNHEGLDETFLIARRTPTEDSPVARLHSPRSGIKVELFTDQEALHVHTWEPGTDSVKLKSGHGQEAPRMAAVAMEMHNWPDAMNHPEWQRGRQTVFGPEGLYTTFSSFKFSLQN